MNYSSSQWNVFTNFLKYWKNECYALRDLVPFAQFKKVENTHWGVLLLVLKVALLHGCFSCFLKLYKWYQIVQSVSNECFLKLNIFKKFRIKSEICLQLLFLSYSWKCAIASWSTCFWGGVTEKQELLVSFVMNCTWALFKTCNSRYIFYLCYCVANTNGKVIKDMQSFLPEN